MEAENLLLTTAARVASVPFRLFGRRGFVPPQKAVILKPCCVSEVMLATPLLAALAETYPRAQFDWAVHAYARPAVATNVRVSELVDTGAVGTPPATRQDVAALVERLREQKYDTCFVPTMSPLLAWIAWRAGIPQRVGLTRGGLGFAHTLAVGVPREVVHAAEAAMLIAEALGIEVEAQMEFFPADGDRMAMTELLVDEVDWLGDVPLVMLHPGGGRQPGREDDQVRWPVERFVLLASQLVRQYGARILLVGAAEDGPLARAIQGMLAAPAVNLAGRLSLNELGALCEMADLYVGNDTGPTQIAAAVGCPTLAIFGPTTPARSAPTAAKGRVVVLWEEVEGPFSWDNRVPAAAAFEAAELLLVKEGAG